MDEAQLYSLLSTSGLPIAYHHFDSPPTPPYVVYLFTRSENVGADNRVYIKDNRYQIELYSSKKDIGSEKIIEDMLDTNEIFYDKTETYIESEGLYEVLYEI